MTKDIRWKQRFQNFEKSYQLLERLAQLPDPSEGEEMGLIQAFEMTFELAWKMMGDYLKAGGYDLNSPKQILKQAFQSGLIDNGHEWMTALDHRNETAHTYNQAIAEKVRRTIKTVYLPEIRKLYGVFKAYVQNE